MKKIILLLTILTFDLTKTGLSRFFQKLKGPNLHGLQKNPKWVFEVYFKQQEPIIWRNIEKKEKDLILQRKYFISENKNILNLNKLLDDNLESLKDLYERRKNLEDEQFKKFYEERNNVIKNYNDLYSYNRNANHPTLSFFLDPYEAYLKPAINRIKNYKDYKQKQFENDNYISLNTEGIKKTNDGFYDYLEYLNNKY